MDIIPPVILCVILCSRTLFLLCTGACKAVQLLQRSPLPDLVEPYHGPSRSCCSCNCCRCSQYPPAKLCETGDLNPAQTHLPKPPTQGGFPPLQGENSERPVTDDTELKVSKQEPQSPEAARIHIYNVSDWNNVKEAVKAPTGGFNSLQSAPRSFH